MRAGAEQGRWANASLDWLPQLLKERLRDLDAGMAGFLNSKPSWKTKQQSLIFTIGTVGGIGWNSVRALCCYGNKMHLNTDLGHVLLVVGPRLGRQLPAENPVAAGVLVLALHRRADALELKLQDAGGKREDMRFLSGNLLQVPISIKIFFFFFLEHMQERREMKMCLLVMS